MGRPKHEIRDFQLLRSIGCGPESEIMNEPRILGDGTLLESLRCELHQKFGEELAPHLLAQIGFYHGLHDAVRALSVSRGDWTRPAIPRPGTPAVSLRIHGTEGHGGVVIRGHWGDSAETRPWTGTDPAKHPCTMTSGYTSGWLSGLCDGSIIAVETECRNAGSEACRFIARPVEAWEARNDPNAMALVNTLPFELFRQDIERRWAAKNHEPSHIPSTSPDAVHVWGPVMVLPFREAGEAQEAAQTLEEGNHHDGISVVVIDLETAPVRPRGNIDSLASLLARIDSWGAETVLANATEEMDQMVSRLHTRPLLSHATREEAIAAAFQIAHAQKHLL